MLMEEAFRNVTIIPLDYSRLYSHFLLEFLVVSGIPGHLVLLFCCPPSPNVPRSYLLYSLCLIDLIFYSILSITGAIALISGGYYIGRIGCKIQYFFIVGALAFTVLLITLISFERHMAVCFQKPLNSKRVSTILLLIAGVSIIYGLLIPLSPESGVEIDFQPHTFICTHAWYSASTFARCITSIAIAILPITIAYICFAYISIYNTFRRAFNPANDQSISSSNLPAPSNNNKDMDVFKTCVIITALYFLTWSPYLIRMIIEIATGQPVNESFAITTEIFAIMNSFLDPYVMMIFDNRIKGTIKRTMIGKAVARLFEKKPGPKTKQNVVQNVNNMTQDDRTKIIT